MRRSNLRTLLRTLLHLCYSRVQLAVCRRDLQGRGIRWTVHSSEAQSSERVAPLPLCASEDTQSLTLSLSHFVTLVSFLGTTRRDSSLEEDRRDSRLKLAAVQVQLHIFAVPATAATATQVSERRLAVCIVSTRDTSSSWSFTRTWILLYYFPFPEHTTSSSPVSALSFADSHCHLVQCHCQIVFPFLFEHCHHHHYLQ